MYTTKRAAWPEGRARPSVADRAKADALARWRYATATLPAAFYRGSGGLLERCDDWPELPAVPVTLTVRRSPITTAAPCSICGDEIRPASNRLQAVHARCWLAAGGAR
jgi:hypothetical protein